MTVAKQFKSRNAFRAAIPWLLAALACGCSNEVNSEWQSLEKSAQTEAKAGNIAEAEQLFKQAIKTAEELQNTELIVTSLLGLSDFYFQAGKSEQCFPILIRAHALAERQQKEFSEGSKQRKLWRNLTARCALARANAFRAQGKYIEAEPLYKQAAELVSNGSQVAITGTSTTSTSIGNTNTTSGSNTNTASDTTTTGNTATSTTGATTTTSATNTNSDTNTIRTTITDAELFATITKEAALMEEYRQNSDDVLDNMVLSGRQVLRQDKFKNKDDYNNTEKEFVGLEEAPRSNITEAKLKARVTEAKALFGIHEDRYRQSVTRLCTYYLNNGEFGKARTIVEGCIKEFQSVEKLTRSDMDFDTEKVADAQYLATALNLLGEVLSRQGYYYSTIKYRERAVILRERWGPRSIEFVTMRRGLADAHLAVQNYPAAMDQLDEALSLYAEVQKSAPPMYKYPSTQYLILASMASIEKLEGSYQKAEQHLKEAKAILNQNPCPDPDLIPDYFLKASALAGAKGHFKEERQYIEAVIDYWKKHKAKNAILSIGHCMQAGRFYHAIHDFANATKCFQIALTQVKSQPKLPSRDSLEIECMQWLGIFDLCTGDIASAERSFKDAKDLLVKRKLNEPRIESTIAFNMAELKRSVGQFEEARELANIADATSQKVLSEAPDHRWIVLVNMVNDECGLNNYATARSLGLETLDIARKCRYRSDLVGSSLCLLAWLNIMDGDTTSALKYLEEAEQACNSSLVPRTNVLTDIHWNKARIWFIKKQDAKAKAELEKAHLVLQKANANFDNILYQWELSTWLRHNRRPSPKTTVAQEALLQIVNDTKSIDQAFQPACHIRSGAAVLTWCGHAAEGRQLEKLACQMRDDELKRRKVR